MPHDEAFPSTNAEWLHQELDAGEERRRALRTVVMARYFEPLRIYVKGSSYRHLGESAELVSAFFVSRFARDDYLDAWRESRMTLRRWLINGLILSMREEVRRRRRAAKRGMQQTHEAPPKRGGISATSPPGRITAYGGSETGRADDVGPLDPLEMLESPEPEAVAAFERAWAVSILREACEEVETICNADGEGNMWLLFTRHFLDGQPYALLVDETGYEPARAAVVARTVANRVRAALKRLIVRDGIPEEEIDAEIARVSSLMDPRE
jgi:hypothetical protein